MRTPTLCAAVALAMLSLPPPADATYPGGNGNIAFVDAESDRGGEGFTDLRLLARTGAVLNAQVQHCAFHEFEDLPDERGCPGDPSFSPNGARLAFPVDGRLTVAAADGSGRTLLRQLTDADTEPDWTREGNLLFTGRRSGRRNLYLVNATAADCASSPRAAGARAPTPQAGWWPTRAADTCAS